MGLLDKLLDLGDMVETISDGMTKDVNATQMTGLYKYEHFVNYVKKKQKEFPKIAKCTIAVEKREEFDNMTFSSEKYVIRIVMLDEMKNPICFDGKKDEYVGTVIIAEAIDGRLKEFMGDKTVKTVRTGGK